MKIAIIGTGISGLATAHLLHPHHQIAVYEKAARAGGHARTLTIDYDGTPIAVDTGFIVFNYRNYPHLLGLFKQLDVPHHKSDMSFAASVNDGAFEYSSASLRGMFPTLASLGEARRYAMLRDYFRFCSHAKRWLEAGEEAVTLKQLVDASGVGEEFKYYFILPIGAAIWSCPVTTMFDYPARTFVRFFVNHGLLSVNGQPQWYTVTGGSQTYVDKVVQSFHHLLRLGCGVAQVERLDDGVRITDESGNVETFDQVVFASHADETLAMLVNPSPEERRILGAFRFQENQVYLHRDISVMPKHKACWASWVYSSAQAEDNAPQLAITYWMNRLQKLPADKPLFVTLNPHQPLKDGLVYNKHRFTHPIFDEAAIAAQSELESIQGISRIWYCGAWQRYGFHEDGIHSAVAVAQGLGADIPWA